MIEEAGKEGGRQATELEKEARETVTHKWPTVTHKWPLLGVGSPGPRLRDAGGNRLQAPAEAYKRAESKTPETPFSSHLARRSPDPAKAEPRALEAGLGVPK